MDVLCVAAHPDDEVLGVGGSLARHSANGDDVHVCILSDGVTSRYDDATQDAEEEIDKRREQAEGACGELDVDSVSFHEFPDNRFDTVPLLDIVKTVEEEVARVEPRVVYTHHYGDLNVDHEITCRAVVTAARPLRDTSVERVLAFETLSATEWGVPNERNAFQPTVFTDISEYLEKKLGALKHYEGELREHPHPRTLENLRGNAELWGAKAGVGAAEAFELLREVR